MPQLEHVTHFSIGLMPQLCDTFYMLLCDSKCGVHCVCVAQEGSGAGTLDMLSGLGVSAAADARLQLHSVLAGGKRRVTAEFCQAHAQDGGAAAALKLQTVSCLKVLLDAEASVLRMLCSCVLAAVYIVSCGAHLPCCLCLCCDALLCVLLCCMQLLFRVQAKSWLKLLIAPLGGSLEALGRSIAPVRGGASLLLLLLTHRWGSSESSCAC